MVLSCKLFFSDNSSWRFPFTCYTWISWNQIKFNEVRITLCFIKLFKINISQAVIAYKKAILKYFAISIRKHLCWILFLTKLQAWRLATLLKRDSRYFRVFSCEYCKTFKNSYFEDNIYLLCTFLAQTLYTPKEPIKVPIFETLECSGQNLQNSSCQFWNDNSYSNFTSFFTVMTHKSSVKFKLIHFLLLVKESHQSPNFKIIQVLCWKLAIFFMSFSKSQLSFSLNFASLFSVMNENSSGRF